MPKSEKTRLQPNNLRDIRQGFLAEQKTFEKDFASVMNAVRVVFEMSFDPLAYEEDAMQEFGNEVDADAYSVETRNQVVSDLAQRVLFCEKEAHALGVVARICGEHDTARAIDGQEERLFLSRIMCEVESTTLGMVRLVLALEPAITPGPGEESIVSEAKEETDEEVSEQIQAVISDVRRRMELLQHTHQSVLPDKGASAFLTTFCANKLVQLEKALARFEDIAATRH